MQILILGGGVFLGAAILRTALERGHELSVFSRGRAQSAWPGGVQAIVGDRATVLDARAGKARLSIGSCWAPPTWIKQGRAERLQAGGVRSFARARLADRG